MRVSSLPFLSRFRRPILVPAAGALAVATALSGCTPGGPGRSTAALVPLVGCSEALDFVREVALERMNKQIDDRLAEFDKGVHCQYAGFAEGDSAPTRAAGGNGATQGGSPSPAPSAPSDPGTVSGGDSGKASSSSGTNNQVAGVDEADFVKNDGKYVYLAQNGALRIVDAWPAATAHTVSKVELDGTPRKLFIDGDRAMVYVSVPDPRRTGSSSSGAYNGPRYGGKECTYGYGCDFTGDGTATKLEVFDVADRANPKLVREVFLSGSLIAARKIGKTTHTVVADNLSLFPELQYYVNVNLCSYQEAAPNFTYSPNPIQPPASAILAAHQAYEALREKNRQIIINKNLAGALPSIADSAAGPAAIDTPVDMCTGLYRAKLLDGASFTSVVSVGIDDAAPAKTASIVSSPGAVYASDRSLYMAVPSEQTYGGPWYDGYGDVKQVSSIHEFRITEHVADTGYVGSGIVKGRVLNQFAMDEKGEYFRIATTTGHVPDPKVESQLTVFSRNRDVPGADHLQQLSIVEHIGPKEDIRAVRFDGDQAFVVTFKKTDPLFVIDLKDPADPKITGELKIPGFSTYIHLLDETHLLSIGYDANDHDSFAYFDGVLLQIFDIADPANPLLAHKFKIGTRGSSSEALTNHLAFNYFAPLKMLAVPMTICEGGGDGSYGTNMTFSGLMLFDVDAQTGVSERGRVAYPLPSNTNFASDASCSNWWTNANSDVKRSIFMDRFVYAISDQLLKIQSIDALGSDLQSIDLEPLPSSSSGGGDF